jgi:hypothetical protein
MPLEKDSFRKEGSKEGMKKRRKGVGREGGRQGGRKREVERFLIKGAFVDFYEHFFNTASSAALHIQLCRRMLGLNPGLL